MTLNEAIKKALDAAYEEYNRKFTNEIRQILIRYRYYDKELMNYVMHKLIDTFREELK